MQNLFQKKYNQNFQPSSLSLSFYSPLSNSSLKFRWNRLKFKFLDIFSFVLDYLLYLFNLKFIIVIIYVFLFGKLAFVEEGKIFKEKPQEISKEIWNYLSSMKIGKSHMKNQIGRKFSALELDEKWKISKKLVIKNCRWKKNNKKLIMNQKMLIRI